MPDGATGASGCRPSTSAWILRRILTRWYVTCWPPHPQLATAATPGPSRLIEQRLELLPAQLPLAPLKVLAPFVVGSDSTLHRHLNDLVDVGLVDSLPNQLQAKGRPGRLFYLASLGLTAARSDGVEPSALAQKLGLGGTHAGVAWLSKRLPGLLTAYELLALLAARGPGRAWLDGNRSGDVSRRRAAVPDVVRVLRD